MIPEDCKYTEEHEWVRIEEEDGVMIGLVGITDFAASELGDVVFVELPEVGSEFSQKDPVGTIESVKAVGDLFLPISGEILAINQVVVDNPELVNTDPMEEGWLVKVALADPQELETLMDAAEYAKLLED